MYFSTNSFGMKCRATSRCAPRHVNRGLSTIRTAGNVHATPGVYAARKMAGGSSWRIVCTA